MENKKVYTSIEEATALYKAGEISVEEVNAYLKEQKAGYIFDPATATDEKKQREDQEGFFNPEDRGLKRKPTYLAKPDKSRRTDLAGEVVRQFTGVGTFDVYYDEDGYAVKDVRVN